MAKTNIKRFAKTLLRRYAPKLYARLSARRFRAAVEQLWEREGAVALTHRLIDRQGPRVCDGPFDGVEFVPATFGGHLSPMLLGTYEKELHSTWEIIFESKYNSPLNVGSVEGYYAVGMAMRFSDTPVIAFDPDKWARKTVRKMAEANSTPNVVVEGFCDIDWLKSNLKTNSFVLSDCEGYEDKLFLPDQVSALSFCDLLVEIHEEQSPGVGERLRRRFSETHDCTTLDQQPRELSDLPALPFLSEEEKHLALSEFRAGHQQWLFAQSRGRS